MQKAKQLFERFVQVALKEQVIVEQEGVLFWKGEVSADQLNDMESRAIALYRERDSWLYGELNDEDYLEFKELLYQRIN